MFAFASLVPDFISRNTRLVPRPRGPALIALTVLLAVQAGTLSGCDRPTGNTAAPDEIPEIRLGGPAFGTSYNIRIRLQPESAAARRVFARESSNAGALLEKAVQAEIERINAAMSNWHPESEISRFNRHRTGDPFPISPEFAFVVKEALRIHRTSGGAFDPARERLFELWGFGGGGQAAQRKRIPTPAQIRAVQTISGMQYLRLQGASLRKIAPELRLNLSAIAKGHAVDRIFALLENHALLQGDEKPAVMVEVGGEIRVGRTAAGRKWRLGIERPDYDGGRRAVYRVAELEGVAMATSGDYRNYFVSDEDGVRYGHILDPRTGRPEVTGVAQATVIGPNCMTADALATTLLVLGEEEGLALIAAEPEYAALLLIAENRDDQKQAFRTTMSPGMTRWLRPE